MIENRPLLARLLLLFWAAAAVMGGLFAAAGLRLLGPGEKGGALLLLVLGLTLVAAGIVMGGLCWRIGRLRGPAIELSDEGLLDRRLSPRRIDWQTIDWRITFNGRAYAVQFDVSPAIRAGLGIYWPQRVLGMFSRLLGRPGLTLVTLGTGLSAHQLGGLIEPFKPPAT